MQIERRGKVDELRPGQQAVLENNEIRIRVVNVDEQVAWRHGAFGFTQCRLENIMEDNLPVGMMWMYGGESTGKRLSFLLLGLSEVLR